MDNNRTSYRHATGGRAARKNTALLILAFGIGAAAGVMFGPNSSQKTREDPAHGLEQGAKKLERKVKEVVHPA